MANDFQYGDERDAFTGTEAPTFAQLAQLPDFLASVFGRAQAATPPATTSSPPQTLTQSMGQTYRRIFDALGMPQAPDNSGVMSQIFSHQPPYNYLRNRPSRPEYIAPNTVPYQRFPARPETVAPNPYVTENFPARPDYVAPNTVPYQRFPARPAEIAPNPYVTSEFEDRPRPGALNRNLPPRSDFYSLNTGPYNDRPTYVGTNTIPEKSVQGMTESTGRAHISSPIIPKDAAASTGRAHMRTKAEQEEQGAEEGEFLNNDPNDMRPGSLGEARKLFPGRPLQQAIYYTDEKGRMNRLGVGADTSKLNQDNIARIWEPADMSMGEKAIRGAFEKQGPNPITWSPHKAEGGSLGSAANIAREKATPCHVGLITMAVGGRTDHIPMNVLEGSYVLPADIVSGLGEGNTLAGSKIIENMFKSGPFGVGKPDSKFTEPNYPKAPPMPGFNLADTLVVSPIASGKKEARGGPIMSGNYKPIPIVAAGGEYVIDPDTVRSLGGGSIDKGHEFLDHFVKGARKELVKTLQKLPGPKRD